MSATLLTGVRLLDPTGAEHGRVVDVLLDGGRVAAVVEAGSAARPTPPTVVADLDGRWLGPGLWDAHTHLLQWALARRRLDVSGAGSAIVAAELVRARLRDAPPAPGEMLVGYGFRDALWPDAPTRAVLDAAAGDHAVVLVSGDLHCGWFSSPALRALGVTPTADNVLREDAFMPLQGRFDASSDAMNDAAVSDALTAAASRGVVGVVDLEIDDNVAAWTRRAAGAAPATRVRAGVWPQHLDDVVARGLRTGDPLPGTLGGLVTQGPLKVVVDGSLNTRTALCHEPYPGAGGAHGCGVLSVPPDELRVLMARGHAAGLRCAIHAIGDAANTLVLDAFAATGARGSVEHAQLLTAADVARFAAVGVTASVQPEHAIDDRDVADDVWADRTDRAFRLADLHRAGVRLALGSDAPVAPLDPWGAIAAAVHRSRDDRPAWHPEQHLDVGVALAASTDGVPRVAAGGPADVVVLDEDPLTHDPRALRDIRVTATAVAGRWSHVGDDVRGVLPA